MIGMFFVILILLGMLATMLSDPSGDSEFKEEPEKIIQSSTIVSEPDKKSIEWTTGKNNSTVGGISVCIHDIELYKKKTSKSAGMTGRHLAIFIGMYNDSSTNKITYLSWRNNSLTTLTDNFGNNYKRLPIRSNIKDLAGKNEKSMYPGEIYVDLLLFEVPIHGVEYLHLTLPGDSIEQNEDLHFEISAIQLKDAKK